MTALRFGTLLMLAAAPATAQVGGGLLLGRESATLPGTPGGFLVEPHVTLRHGGLRLQGTASLREEGVYRTRWLSDVDATVALSLRRVGAFGLGLDGSWRTAAPRWDAAAGHRDLLLTARRGGDRAGFSVGAGIGQATTGSGTATAPTIRLEGWNTWRGFRIAGLLQHSTGAGERSEGGRPPGVDTTLLAIYIPVTKRMVVAGVTEAGVTANARFGRTAITATAGMLYVHGSGRMQGSFSVLQELAGPVALNAGYARRVFDPVAGRSSDAFRMGLTLRTAKHTAHESETEREAPAIVARRDDLLVTLGFRIAAAKTVELRGEMTGWEVVRLTTDDGRWVWRGAAAPGTSRLQLRIDGGPWVRPPGSTAAVDPYGEPIGIVTIP